MTQFLGLLLDPFIDGRGDAPAPAASATPYAEDSDGANAYASSGRKRTGAEREPHAALYNNAPPPNPLFDPRWSVGAAGFGGPQTTDGIVGLGQRTTTPRVFVMPAVPALIY